jgi:hypothetical protein
MVFAEFHHSFVVIFAKRRRTTSTDDVLDFVNKKSKPDEYDTVVVKTIYKLVYPKLAFGFISFAFQQLDRQAPRQTPRITFPEYADIVVSLVDGAVKCGTEVEVEVVDDVMVNYRSFRPST